MSQVAQQSGEHTSSAIGVIPGDAPSFALDGNYLTIMARSEKEFLAGYEEAFWALMHSEEAEVTIDLARAEGVGDDVFRMIALNMFEVTGKKKQITIRIPEELERLFKHANLYRVAEIEVVHLLGRARKKQVGSIGNDDGEPSREESLPPTQAATVPPKPAPATTPAPAPQPAAASAHDDDDDAPLGETAQAGWLTGSWTAAEAGPQNAGDDSVVSDKKRQLETALRERHEAQQRAAAGAAAAGGESGAALGGERRGAGRLVDRRTGQLVELAKNPTNIGRVPGNDILIAMPLVSKRHARIEVDGDGLYWIEDLKSSNGTYVNGERLSAPKLLQDGARVQVAITSQYPNGAKEYTFRQDES